MEIIPTTNPLTNFAALEARLVEIKDLSPWIQIDVTDGIFAAPPTFPLELLNRSDSNLENNLFDIHLMVKEPQNWLNKCLFIQASRVSAQVEMMSDREKFVTEAKNAGFEVALAFNIDTPVTDIPSECDLILLMGRPAGFGDYPLSEKIYSKIKEAKKFGKKIAVDGGVTPENLPLLKAASVDIIYSGQYFFKLINEEAS